MYHLFLIRHAQATPTWETGGKDFDRPLTDSGRQSFQMLAMTLPKGEESPDLLLHSPRRRAVETTDLLEQALGIPDLERAEEAILSSSYSVQELRSTLASYGHASRPAVIAHQPSLGWMVNELTGGQMVAFTPGTIVRLDFEDKWRDGDVGRVWECL